MLNQAQSPDGETRRAPAAGAGALILTLLTAIPVAVQAEEVEKSLTLGFESEVIVSVDESRLTEAELDSFLLYEIPASDRASFVSSARRIAGVIENQITQQRIAERAIEDGVLDDTQLSAGLYRQAISLIAGEYLDLVVEPDLLDDYTQQARELYLTEPDRFRTPPRYSFTHLLLRTAERGETEAMKRILELHDRVSDGEDFEALVDEFSDDSAAANNGGRYTRVTLEDLDENFARTLRDLETAGAISAPVRSRFGWHLIRLDEFIEPETKSWDEAADQARNVARQRHEHQLRQRFMSEVMETGSVESLPGIIESFQERHGYQPGALSGSVDRADSDSQP